MDILFSLLRTNSKRWLIVPRFAVVTWSLTGTLIGSTLIIPSSLTVGVIFTALFLTISFLGIIRLSILTLLPFERRSLADAESLLSSSRLLDAKTALEKQIPCAGIHYHLQQSILLAKVYVQLGDVVSGLRALRRIRETKLLNEEQKDLKIAEAYVFLEAGNPTEASAILDKVSDSSEEQRKEIAKLRGIIALTCGKLTDARDYFEELLQRDLDTTEKIKILNNLAIVDLKQGRTSFQIDRLEAAWMLFSAVPNKNLPKELYHNFTIGLIRAGRIGYARKIIEESKQAIDPCDLDQVLAVLNVELEAAREARDPDWKHSVNKNIENCYNQMRPLSPRREFAFKISGLRVRRNDGTREATPRVEEVIKDLLSDFERLPSDTPLHEKLSGLQEVHGELRHEFESRGPKEFVEEIVSLVNDVATRLVGYSEEVNQTLHEIPPKLTSAVKFFRGHQACIDKMSVQLAQSSESRGIAYRTLFGHLRESAESSIEIGNKVDAVENWFRICDDFIGYYEQSTPEERSVFCINHFPGVSNALEEGLKVLESKPDLGGKEELLLGAAFFCLQLRRDRQEAIKYLRQFNEISPPLDHYALWLRKRYSHLVSSLRQQSP